MRFTKFSQTHGLQQKCGSKFKVRFVVKGCNEALQGIQETALSLVGFKLSRGNV